jgi:hypothetical protein
MVPRSTGCSRAFIGLACGAFGLVLSACFTPFGAGVHAFSHGRYPEALEQLAVAEHDAKHWSSRRERTRYALYRGLTHLALGHRVPTMFWLGEAKRALDADPLLLSDGDAGRLASAWAHLPFDDDAFRPQGGLDP